MHCWCCGWAISSIRRDDDRDSDILAASSTPKYVVYICTTKGNMILQKSEKIVLEYLVSDKVVYSLER